MVTNIVLGYLAIGAIFGAAEAYRRHHPNDPRWLAAAVMYVVVLGLFWPAALTATVVALASDDH
jgi:hypothetical protein